ncbi:hypothetical protein JCM14720_13010 [Calditerricola yamamurae]
MLGTRVTASTTISHHNLCFTAFPPHQQASTRAVANDSVEKAPS